MKLVEIGSEQVPSLTPRRMTEPEAMSHEVNLHLPPSGLQKAEIHVVML